MTEALATVCTALAVIRQAPKTSVEIAAPTIAQAMLAKSLVSDFGASRILVSVAPARRKIDAPPITLVASLLPDNQDETGYAEMLRELIRRNMRPDQDAIVSVGEQPLQPAFRDTYATEATRASRRVPLVQPFSDREDLIRQLLSLLPEAQQQMLPLRESGGMDNIQRKVENGDRANEMVVCLCDTALPPIAAALVQSLSDNRADILTNSIRLVGEQAATSRALQTMHDFANEAVMCVVHSDLVLVEPQLDLGGKHWNSTLLMRGSATARFITHVALGVLDGQVTVVVPQSSPPEGHGCSTFQEEGSAESTETTTVRPLESHATDATGKKTRCRRYSDLHEKKLREVLNRMTPDEVKTLLAALESLPAGQGAEKTHQL